MKKKLVLIAAPPASGKTYVAERLAQRLSGAVYIDKDSLAPLVDCAFKLAGREYDMDCEFYREHIRKAEYDTAFALAIEALKYTDMVLLGAPFGVEIQNTAMLCRYKQILNNDDIELVFVWILACADICKKRMIKRNATRDIGKLAAWESYISGISFDIPIHLREQNAVDRLLVFDNIDDKNFAKALKSTVKNLKR